MQVKADGVRSHPAAPRRLAWLLCLAGAAGIGALGAGGGCAGHAGPAARIGRIAAAPQDPSGRAVSCQEFRVLPASAQRDRIRRARPFLERSRAIVASLDRIERAREKPWSTGFVREPEGGVLDAVACLQAATRLDPSNGGAWCDLGRLNAATVLALRGRVRFARKEYPLAEEDLRAAHDAFARAGLTDPETNLRLGQILLQRKQPDTALPFLERAVASDSTRTELLDVYGATLLETARPRRGRAVLESALALDRRRASVLYNLGLLDLMESRLADGIAHLEEAQALAPQDQTIARLLQVAKSNHSAAPIDTTEQGYQ